MSAEWNANLYLKFEDERNQPARDLITALAPFRPETIADLGCGPGNSTALLREAFPEARITGLDSSADMIEKARQAHPDLAFEQADLRALTGSYDLLFSNACLQWVPEHETLLPALMAHLNHGGVLAAQFPMNEEEPLYQTIADVISEERWGFQHLELDYNGYLRPHQYFDLLSGHCASFRIWETKYYHHLADHAALIEWVSGSKIRPYLQALEGEKRERFRERLLQLSKEDYDIRPGGGVILHFNRFFFIGVKG